MKKLIVVVCLMAGFMLSGISYAACGGEYDYSELKDMSQPDLLKTYCENYESTHTIVMANIYAGRRYQHEVDRCIAVSDKIERVYMKKFKVEDREILIKMCNFPK